jgi:phosphatidate cytidylyltransferase
VSNVVQRLLIFFLGVPATAAVIIFLPGYRHLAAVAVTVGILVMCAIEMAKLFKARGVPVGTVEMVVLALIFPIGAYASNFAPEGPPWTYGAEIAICVAAAAAVFGRLAFSKAESIPDILPRAAALALNLVYVGAFGAFIVLIASEPPRSAESLLTFCLLCFGNDGMAWLVGMTLGRRRGVVAVSPNKSVAGFVGGMAGSIITIFLCALLFPSSLAAPWWALLGLALLIGAAAIVGDLFESALKRSAGTKDSGSVVPGRGGFLDSFDSLLMAAPAFYAASLLLGLFR